MGRAALNWSTQELARKSGVGANTVNRFESGQDARVSSVDKMRKAMEDSGVVFITEGETSAGGGPGVRLSK
nr:helix-turn-helix transcriptional regulator [Sinorhizobium sp. BJ1]